ncbi:metal-dependent hydrolase, partial [Francisella tularensis subsp. holarctica]|nr:metal-dependent hydrolase [Francisella tularensis subsp. holarctica]
MTLEQVINNAKKADIDKIFSIAVAWHEIEDIQKIAEV